MRVKYANARYMGLRSHIGHGAAMRGLTPGAGDTKLYILDKVLILGKSCFNSSGVIPRPHKKPT